MNKPKIATYKGVDIFYNVDNGKLYFDFDGARETKYLFEAKQVIDEPRWKECDMQGFYLDHSLEYHIGLAKASRIDIKSGRPDWLYKGKYDTVYKPTNSWREDTTIVYSVNDKTKTIYKEWRAQRDVATIEQIKADNIAQSLRKVLDEQSSIN